MILGAYGIPPEDYPLALSLGLKYSVGAEIVDMGIGAVEMLYVADEVNLNGISRERVEDAALAARANGLAPFFTVSEGLWDAALWRVRDWAKEYDPVLGQVEYVHDPWIYGIPIILGTRRIVLPIPVVLPLWNRVRGFVAREVAGLAWRGRRWAGVASCVYAEEPGLPLGPSSLPLWPGAVQAQINHCRAVGASHCFFYLWSEAGRDALTEALTYPEGIAQPNEVLYGS